MAKYTIILILFFKTVIIFSQTIEVESDTYLYSSPFYTWNENGFLSPQKILSLKKHEQIFAIGFYLIGDDNNYVGDIKVRIDDKDGWVSSICFNSEKLRKIPLIYRGNDLLKPIQKESVQIEPPTPTAEKIKETNNPKETKLSEIKQSNNSGIIKVIKMRKDASGTFEIPCVINDLKLNFIFDTGASEVALSITEASFMVKNGYLAKEDIRGSSYAQIANGEVIENTTVILRKLEIDGLILRNIVASITYNAKAPLLLGQSALSQLGKIQLDYSKNTLTILK